MNAQTPIWTVYVLVLLFCCMEVALSTENQAGAGSGGVEIEKQKLVRFPDDDDQQQKQNDAENSDKVNDKENEAKRILEEINKINQALGYVKKQPEQSKLPAILDSSHYLFPKPAYHPFHAQQHQIAGSNGETILVPSIRSVQFDTNNNRHMQYNEPDAQQASYNLETKQQQQKQQQQQHTVASKKNNNKKHKSEKLQIMTLNEYQEYLQHQQQQHQQQANSNNKNKKSHKQSNTQFYYRPNQVYATAAQQQHLTKDKQKLSAHFMIPVRLYKLNKEEYIQKYAPQEYQIKGYKIVGDIDNFYARNTKPHANANVKKTAQSKNKTTPKYHLFFLPRELALNEIVEISKGHAKHTQIANSAEQSHNRVEKVRPLRVQPNVTGKNKASNATQATRKRVTAKPQAAAPATVATLAHNDKITPPPTSAVGNAGLLPAATDAELNNKNKNLNYNTNQLGAFFNRPPVGVGEKYDAPNATTSTNAIKTAFQNIFKFPFRQESKPQTSNAEQTNFEAVPLKMPQKTFFNTQSLIAPASSFFQEQQHQQQNPKDDDNRNESNSALDDDDDDDNDSASPEQSEKQLFGHFHAQHQQTQKEALRQGGIIIQRLKVRKGGIAIAGPGGVATAGSGGTAIVGPGGYALTHPRSLTIAGPGAKIIAIPPNVDLKDALTRTNLNSKSFPREGKIVATGPTVYYSPALPTTDTNDEEM